MEIQWPLVLFTLFVCLGAGSLGAAGACAVTATREKTTAPILILAIASLVVGGICSVFHLQTPERYFNQLGNISSGINQEIIAIGACIVLAVAWIILLRNGRASGTTGKVLGAISIVMAAALVVVMSHSYLMPAIPAWNTLLLPAFYLANALAFGAFVQIAFTGLLDQEHSNRGLAAIALAAIILLAIAIAALVAHLGSAEFAPRVWWDGAVGAADANGSSTALPVQSPQTIARDIVSGSLAPLFWGGAVIGGLVVPGILALLLWLPSVKLPTAVTSFCAIALVAIGTIVFRVILYMGAMSYFAY